MSFMISQFIYKNKKNLKLRRKSANRFRFMTHITIVIEILTVIRSYF